MMRRAFLQLLPVNLEEATIDSLFHKMLMDTHFDTRKEVVLDRITGRSIA